jgi:DNA (cytosine-5)-methyltransferase 1
MRVLSIVPSKGDNMAGPSRPYAISDDDEDDIHNSDTELELLDYGESQISDFKEFTLTTHPDSDGSEPEITGFSSRPSSTSSSASSARKNNHCIKAPDSEIKRYRLSKGCTIQAGDTVELKDSSAHESDLMHSGDFLRIKHIIINLQTNEVRLRGLRLRRVKALKQIFDCRFIRWGL